MSGGFGGGSWGGGAFGGSSEGKFDYTNTVSETITISEGFSFVVVYNPPLAETVTFSEALSVVAPLKLISANAIAPHEVEVTFAVALDPLFAANFDPANYTTVAPLVISAVTFGPTPNTVILVTDDQNFSVYTLTVATAKSAAGDLLSPPNQTTNFAGFAVVPHFFATAQSRRQVRVTFSTLMDPGPALSDPANYFVRDLQGNTIPVLSVTAQPVVSLDFLLQPQSLATLQLGADLVPGGYYVAEVGPAVLSLGALVPVFPSTDLFQWTAMEAPITRGPITIPFSSFSGEVTTGLLGQPAGQIFFSPALLQPAANSILQVDEVSLCTRAFDEYHPPQPVDPPTLFTYSPTAPQGGIGPSTALWSSAERQGIARITLTDTHADTLPAPVDGPCDATLVEPIDITKASFLNDSRWKLFPGTLNFKTASNLAPIGPGPTVNINLEP